MVHTAPHAVDLNISAAAAAGILSIIGATSIVARALIGVTVDRLGSRKALLLCFIPLISSLVWLQFADSLWMLYLFAVLVRTESRGFLYASSRLWWRSCSALCLMARCSASSWREMVSAGRSGRFSPVGLSMCLAATGIPFLVLIGMAVAAMLLVTSLTRTPYQMENERLAALARQRLRLERTPCRRAPAG